MSENKPNKAIISLLNDILTAELVAVNQYFMHAEICLSWGYKKLYEISRAASIDEMRHAEELMKRILLIGGLPNLQRLDALKIGETVTEQMECDLGLEDVAVKRLNEGLKICHDHGDFGTAELLQRLLISEEEHKDFLDTQLNLIRTLGEQAYLVQMIG